MKRRRSYGTGSIDTLPDGRSRARIYVGGKRRQAIRDTHQEAKALEWHADRLREMLADPVATNGQSPTP